MAIKAATWARVCCKAVENVNDEIADALIGWDATDQKAIDMMLLELDGTPNKSKLGANAILGVSLAVAKAAANALGLAAVPLYRRRICPRAARADDEHPQRRRAHRLAIHRCSGIHGHAVWRAILCRRPALGSRNLPCPESVCSKTAVTPTLVGDEGGYAPALKANAEAVEVILEAIEKAGYKAGEQVGNCSRSGASELYEEETSCITCAKKARN